MRRVLVISNMWPSKRNPSYGVFVERCSKLIEDKTFEVIACTQTHPGALRWLRLQIAGVFCLLFEKYSFAYIHYPARTGLLVLAAALLRRGVVIVNFHGSDVTRNTNRWGIGFILVRVALKYADQIVAPSDNFVATLRFVHGDKLRKKVHVIPSGGLDEAFFSTPLRVLHSSEKVSRPVQVIGFVDSAQVFKGRDVVQALITLLPKAEISLVVVGCTAKVAKAWVGMENEYNTEVHGFLNQKQMIQFYDGIEVLVFASLIDESLGLCPLEAMARGVLVVASDLPATRGYIKPGVNGYLVRPGDHYGFAETLKEIKALSETDKRLLSQAAVRAAEEYSAVRAGDKYATLLENSGLV
ncbi:glycosyltransferase family 4 protein [Luminiphilus sp.]|nr:glycosyltransferase family 4 protein [Luminiphilus sp.]MDB2352875.1 glycosyltransferase family 4 protein [Luminiphilus sp.]